MPALPTSLPTPSLPSPTLPGAHLNLPRKPLRVVLITCSDAGHRERLSRSLTGLRWQVIEARGGADAWAESEKAKQLEVLLVDPWLPDLDISEFLADFHREKPTVALMFTDGSAVKDSPRSPYHQELLYALRHSQESDTVAWQASRLVEMVPDAPTGLFPLDVVQQTANGETTEKEDARSAAGTVSVVPVGDEQRKAQITERRVSPVDRIPELIGFSGPMLEVSRRIRLVAARLTPVLIEGPTGSGKELVAEALHRLSSRSKKAFVAINCAAIPEALLEAELFGHTRGAFTGAVQGRIGRIESADGGTLFLDEIGEMPLALQSKLLRFVESGELQRIGDNDTVKVDVRILAATHQRLAEHAQKGAFRSDLYYRLAVFLIRTPALSEHLEDLPVLIEHFLERMGRTAPVKRLDAKALDRLRNHDWPGNVRELEHVLERAAILAGDEPVIGEQEVDFGLLPPN